MLIRKVLVASAALAALTAGSAFAADLPSRVTAPAPYIAPLPVFTWTGFYVGLNAGAGFGSSNNGTLGVPAGTLGTDYTTYGSGSSNVGFVGGGQIGYNWQAGALVFGLETDLQDRNRGNRTLAEGTLPGSGAYYYGVSSGSNSTWFGTARGRVGFAVDRALFYATGGLAYGGHQNGVTAYYNDGTNPTAAYNSSSNSSGVGYTLGGGIEYAITPTWTIKGEYLWVDLGKKSSTLTTASTVGTLPSYITTGGSSDRFSVARVGVNYKF